MTLPLDGLRVLDLSRILAGPSCTQTLGDLGADVVKIERPGIGDDIRGWGPPFLKDRDGNDTRESAYFMSTNRNKRSLTVDIGSDDGLEIIHDLIDKSDVLVENLRLVISSVVDWIGGRSTHATHVLFIARSRVLDRLVPMPSGPATISSFRAWVA